MQTTTLIAPLSDVPADWLIVGLWEHEPLSGPVAGLDTKLSGLIAMLVERGDVACKAKELTPLQNVPGIAALRLLLVGLGTRAKAEVATLHDAFAAAAKSVTSKACRRLAAVLPSGIAGLDLDAVARAVVVGLRQGCEGPGLRKSKPDRFLPDELCLVPTETVDAGVLASAVKRAEIEARAVSLARELVNLPPCDLYPESFADKARDVAKIAGLECRVLEQRQLEDENMNALLAVARGSDKPPRLVLLKHLRGGDAPTLALVGKGVTFDSGGLSLKTTDQMVDMKCDMAGAATVLAAMLAIAELEIPVNVIGVLALVENMPGGRAMKLGDVLHARNGKTIEVLNTDAEGRLILADALSYAIDQKAAHLVDLATLTGACMVALGHHVAGAMSNDEVWSRAVLDAAKTVGEQAWPLPMFPQYAEMIRSDVADIRNTGGSRYAGAISAAKFLEEFVAEKPWVHFDIAGPAWAEHDSAVRESGGTGCFVRTLVELARRYRK